MTDLFVDRRTLIAEMMALLGAATCPSQAIGAIASKPAREGTKASFLDEAELALLREMAEAMIPRTNTPGAVDAAVPEFLDGLMIDWAGQGARDQLRRAISDYRVLAESAGKNSAGRLEAMVELDRRSFVALSGDAGANAYRWLKRLVFLVYRTSEAAFTNYVPNPGSYRGNLSRAQYEAFVAEHSVSAA